MSFEWRSERQLIICGSQTDAEIDCLYSIEIRLIDKSIEINTFNRMKKFISNIGSGIE